MVIPAPGLCLGSQCRSRVGPCPLRQGCRRTSPFFLSWAGQKVTCWRGRVRSELALFIVLPTDEGWGCALPASGRGEVTGMREQSWGWPPASLPCLLRAAGVTLLLLPQHAAWHWVALLKGMQGGDGGPATSLLFHPGLAWLDGHQNRFPCFVHACFATPALLACSSELSEDRSRCVCESMTPNPPSWSLAA